MSEIHNLNYYFDFYDQFSEFQKNNLKRNKIQSYLNPLTSVTEPLTEEITTSYVFPLLKKSYSFLGSALVRAATLYDKDIGGRLERKWNDPLGTENLTSVAEKVENLTRKVAVSKPYNGVIFNGLNKCFITINRHIYVFSKDIRTLLTLPDRIHRYIDESTADSEISHETSSPGQIDESTAEPRIPHEIPPGSKDAPKEVKEKPPQETILGRSWRWFKEGTEAIKNGIVFVVREISRFTFQYFLQYIPILNHYLKPLEENFGELGKQVSSAIVNKYEQEIKDQEVKVNQKIDHFENTLENRRIKLHEDLKQQAHSLLSAKENQIRKKLVDRTLEISGRNLTAFCVSSILKSAIPSAIAYYGAPLLRDQLAIWGLSSNVQLVGSVALAALGGAVWLKCLAPSYCALRDAYQEHFDPDASTFQELTDPNNFQKWVELIQSINCHPDSEKCG